MPRKQYFFLDSGVFFEMEAEPPPMTKDESKRYQAALKIVEENISENKSKKSHVRHQTQPR